jgi:hypothetical protein
MQVIKNRNIPLSLQLIKADLTYEDDAVVNFSIYNSDTTTLEVIETTANWNSILNSYTSTLIPSASWVNQEVGNYLLVWNISNTDYFASTMIEEFVVIEDSNTRLNSVDGDLNTINNNVLTNITHTLGISGDLNTINNNVLTNITHTLGISGDLSIISLNVEKILGLVHQNMVIDETLFDTDGNLYSARVRIFRDSAKTDLISTYRITAATTGPGKFSSWEQIEE